MQYTTLVILARLASLATAFTRNGVSSRDIIDEVEHVMVDQFGYNQDPFVAAITPCGTYLSGNQSMGEQSTAQWVRLAFHDFVTADISTGLGGLDNSISFETNRVENAGLFVNDTINFFSPIMSAYMSVSDAIALGVAMSLAVCGGSISTPGVRVGRIDATEAGPAGVPEPNTDLETTLAQFASAGFSASDTIALTACGHSLGRVHYTTFPDIVPESAVTADNLDGGVPFDSTPDVFDNAGVTEYLEGTGSLGGPLVTAANVSDRSDYRLYISDANATVQTLSAEDSFQATCATLFEKMMNVVPATVTLTDAISPMTWKGVDLQLDVDSAGGVSVSGIIRYLYDISSTTSPATVSYTYTSSSGNSSEFETTAIAGTGYGLYGNSTFYSFNTTTESPGTTAVNFGTASYEISDDIFVIPAQSTINGSTISITGAALTSAAGSDMTATFWVPTTQALSVAKNVVNVTVAMSETEVRGNYTLFSGSGTVDATAGATFGHVIAVVQSGDVVSDTIKASLFVDLA